MGRPREHDEEARASLRAAAERLVAEGGTAAFSVRAVADAAGTTTRAVYSLFGSKEGLLVDALAQGAFEFLFEHIAELDEGDDPVADVVEVGMVFRRLVREHPALYRIAFQRVLSIMRAGPELTAARTRAWEQLVAKVKRLDAQGLLGDTSARTAAVELNAMFEGLANAELRGTVFPNLPPGEQSASAWRAAIETVIRGLAVSAGV